MDDIRDKNSAYSRNSKIPYISLTSRLEAETVKSLDLWSLKNSFCTPRSSQRTTTNNDYSPVTNICMTERSNTIATLEKINHDGIIIKNKKFEARLNENFLLTKYNNLNTELQSLAETKLGYIAKKSDCLARINALKIKNTEYQEKIKRVKAEQNNPKPKSPIPSSNKIYSKVYYLSKFTKGKEIGELVKDNELEIFNIKHELEQAEYNINFTENKITETKEEIQNIRIQLNEIYLNLLENAEDLRGEGLSWIIKAILHIKGVIKTIKFPYFLDHHSIEYLISTSKKEFQISLYKQDAAKLKDNGTALYIQQISVIHRKIQQLKDEINISRKLETQRLTKELTKNPQRYNVTQEKLFATLFGVTPSKPPDFSLKSSVFLDK